MSIKIEILDPIYSQVTGEKKLLYPPVTYKYVFYQQGRYGKIRREGKKSMINRSGIFYTGLLPLIENYCDKKKIDINVIESDLMKEIQSEVVPTNDIYLPGIELREDQKRLVWSALKHKRGMLIAPTGTGKSILALSIMKAFQGKIILFLVPSLDLLKQTEDELDRFGFKSITTLGGGKPKHIYGQITVSTIQTMIRMDLDQMGHIFDLVIVDELHLASGVDATLEKILSKIPAPYRIGFTATPPTEEQKRLTITGLLGPIIDEVTWEEGREENMLVEPWLKLVNVPKCSDVDNQRSYKDEYRVGIVENKTRHRIILREAQSLANSGVTSLIFVNIVEHGQRLFDTFNKSDIKCTYVKGDVDSDTRNKIKKQLEQGELDCVISTVWKEGVNIPSLGAIILAGGGKSEIALMQKIGRSLRRSEGKDQAIIVDFVDIGRHLSQHVCERIHTYIELRML